MRQKEAALSRLAEGRPRVGACRPTAHLDLRDVNVCVVLDERRVRATVIDFGLAHFDFERRFFRNIEEDLDDHNTLVEELPEILWETCASEDETKGRGPVIHS